LKNKAKRGHEKRRDTKIWAMGGVLLIIALVASGILLNSPEDEIVFDYSKRLDNLFVVPLNNLDADWYDVCELEMATPVAYDQGRMLFLSPYNRDFNFNFRYDFDTGRANRNNRIWIDLKKHSAWQGSIRGILIVPAANADTVTLKKIRFVHGNLWTEIKAWWGGFTYYYDPLLGTCFAMASPFFIKGSYNALFVPLLWVAFILAGVLALFDKRIAKIAIGAFFLLAFLIWGMLDLRYHVYYLKAMRRDANLYWGKSLHEKRKIVTGDPEFIDFMKFCDEAIPLNGKIINGVPTNLPKTPPDYLAKV